MVDQTNLLHKHAGFGLVSGAGQWLGVFAPARTPADVVRKLNEEINKALSTAKVQEVIRTLGAEPMVSTRAEFIAKQEADRTRFGAFIRANKITAD